MHNSSRARISFDEKASATLASVEGRDPALDIRRPELRGNGQRRTGTVRWYKSEKGYGRITADDGEILFVHFSGIVGEGEEFRELTEGQRVSFLTGNGVADHNRSLADDVRIADEV